MTLGLPRVVKKQPPALSVESLGVALVRDRRLGLPCLVHALKVDSQKGRDKFVVTAGTARRDVHNLQDSHP